MRSTLNRAGGPVDAERVENDRPISVSSDGTTTEPAITCSPVPSAELRFWERVEQTPGCWLWSGCVTSRGYGWLMVDQVQWTAHRFMWTTMFGPIPEGMFVCHHCDNPRCVKPSHLFLGTAKDNMQDMIAKGRYAGGPNAPGGARKPREPVAPRPKLRTVLHQPYARRTPTGRPRAGTKEAILLRYGGDDAEQG